MVGGGRERTSAEIHARSAGKYNKTEMKRFCLVILCSGSELEGRTSAQGKIHTLFSCLWKFGGLTDCRISGHPCIHNR